MDAFIIVSVGWKSFKGNMNRVESGESASETRRAGRAKLSARANLNFPRSHERAPSNKIIMPELQVNDWGRGENVMAGSEVTSMR